MGTLTGRRTGQRMVRRMGNRMGNRTCGRTERNVDRRTDRMIGRGQAGGWIVCLALNSIKAPQSCCPQGSLEFWVCSTLKI